MSRRVLVGGVGYRNLRDHSAGVAVVDRLMTRAWPEGVVVEDVSYNPVAVAQWLEAEAAARPFGRAVLVSAVARGARPVATVTAYRWDGVLPDDGAVHRAVTEAVTGVIALDNTLVVTRHMGALPDDVVVVEIEPGVEEFGEAPDEAVAAVLDDVCALAADLAVDPTLADRLPLAPLGGPAVAGAAAP
jgi:hydrogenase maturation protease